jgi:ubiquinone/menaquinone biosynthesis C-methylase UbiE
MNHDDHVRLIARGIEPDRGGVWAEFGAGSGAFTLAMRELAGPDVEIIAIDADAGSLRALQGAMDRQFPGTRLVTRVADFTAPLDLPPLDGMLAANALHYVRNQVGVLQQWRGYLKPGGRLIVVEYDTDAGNRWVPHPFSFATFGALAQAAGFTDPMLLGTYPSRFLGGFFAAVTRPVQDSKGVLA